MLWAKLGLVLFVLVFLMISPSSRNFIGGHLDSAMDQINAWAPFSYVLLAMVGISPIAAMIVINTWPKRVEPEDPMAKYRKQELSEDFQED